MHPPAVALPPTRPSARRLWAFSIVIALVALAIFAALEVVARAARRIGTAGVVPSSHAEVVLARNGAEVLGLWRARGVGGRIVVHVGRFLHFVEPEQAAHLQQEVLTGVGTGRRLVADLAAMVRSENYLWTASETGVARTVLFTEPSASLLARASALDLALAEGEPLDLEYKAFPREAGTDLPRVGEPVLLDIGASYFDEGTGEALMDMLRRAGLRSDLVTLNLLEGNEDVSDSARARLRAFRLTIASSEGR